MSEDKLLPCLCGSPDVTGPHDTVGGDYYIFCEGCGGKFSWVASRLGMITRWNTRPSPWRKFDADDMGTWPEKLVYVFVWPLNTGPPVTFHNGADGFHRFAEVTHWAPMSALPPPPSPDEEGSN